MATPVVFDPWSFASVCILSRDGQDNFLQGVVEDGHINQSHAIGRVEIGLKLRTATPEERLGITVRAATAGAVTPDMLAMAMAVLHGDTTAALQLADRVTEAYGR